MPTVYRIHEVADIFPPMSPEEYQALKADIQKDGQREPIWLHEGAIIDGKNRDRACRELGIPLRVRNWDGKGSLTAFVVSLNLHRRHLNPSQKAFVGERTIAMFEKEAGDRQRAGLKQGDKAPVSAKLRERDKGKAAEKAAKSVGVSPRYVEHAKKIRAKAPELAKKVVAGKMSISQANRELKERERETRRKTIRPESHGIITDLGVLVAAGAKFPTIYADPPWQYSNSATRSNAKGQYKATMTVEEICAEPVRELVTDDAHLHLWTTNGFLFEAKRVMEAWGFTYKSCFVWVKPQLGIGNYWRVSHEFLLLGVRGKLRFADRGQKSWMSLDRTKHSCKPPEVRAAIEKVSPGPYLELYGRQGLAAPWTVYGNEVAERKPQ